MKKLIAKKYVKTKNNIKKWRTTGRIIFILLLALGVGIYALRQNNIEALRLYNKVISADKYGGDLDSSLSELQKFSRSHMNTQLRQPVQLVETYNKQAVARIKEAQSSNPDIEAIYQEAQNECSKAGVPYTVIAKCASDYALSKTNPNYDPTSPPEYSLPDPAEYTYSFASPYWTPDLAGLSLSLAILALAVLIFRALFHFYASMIARKKNKQQKAT